MARYKVVDRSPRFLPIVLDAQLITGSFEYALVYLIDNEIDLSHLAKRYRNDEMGAPAYDPAVMLKIVLLAYSRGIVSSRARKRSWSQRVRLTSRLCETQNCSVSDSPRNMRDNHALQRTGRAERSL